VRWRPLVLVLALVVLAGGWRVWDAFTTPQVAFITPTPQVDVDCGDFANQVEAQFRLRRALDPPDGVHMDYFGQDPGPEARREQEKEYVARVRREAPAVIKALDPDGDDLACNRGPTQLPLGPVSECADYNDQTEAQERLREALDPQDAVQQLPEGRVREYLARHRRDQPRVIKSLDPDGDGKACNKEPDWLPPRKAPE
jgi:hypothetical protein